ncbi:2-phosphosulfolactate phosphatase [Stieleria sp. TO1_6]|uniref:2-phosphosulfolactate phosphatase n=1 Tax=Stieleria tagensis TaxID=2956795 RepID=UPI00209BAD4B|nr:2-phosphosulfolactate phosphatase [Stieleria tagensis]MCO8124989.1 2-phosphosulfolactate phosphatase [Stieleria tagensis]
MKSISVALLPGTLSAGLDRSKTCAVVIDVLRATSVMTTAGAAGAATIRTCEQTERARQIATESTPTALLCGERECKPIAGFDLGNSPAEYGPDRLAGRDLVLTTTNGTRAIRAVQDCRRLLVSSFLNLQATIDAIESETQLQFVCAGTNGEISYEDVLLAGAIVQRLNPSSQHDLIDDSARIAMAAWQQSGAAGDRGHQALRTALGQSLGGRNLASVGFAADIDRCARIDTISGIVTRAERSSSADSDVTTFRYANPSGSVPAATSSSH